MAGHINYADALNVENQYWQDMRGFKHTTKPFTRTVVGGLKDSRSTPNTPPPAVDLTWLSKGQIVEHLLDVQEAKLNYRLRIKRNNTAYVTAFGYNAVDTCREQIIFYQDVFNHSFLYNGDCRSQQPGNCVLARPNGYATTYNALIDRNSPEGVLCFDRSQFTRGCLVSCFYFKRLADVRRLILTETIWSTSSPPCLRVLALRWRINWQETITSTTLCFG